MARNLTQQERNHIRELYLTGSSYSDIYRITGAATKTITSIVRGLRSISDASKLARQQGKCKLTDDGRRRLSDAGKRSCQKNGKYWTKPERGFKRLLNEVGIGVQFPTEIAEALDIKNDENATICFQFPIQRYVCDFVDVAHRIVFRVQGDFWHANPILYDRGLTTIQKHNVRQDRNCRTFLEKRGWTVVDVWESEIYWNSDVVKQRVRACSSEEERFVYTEEVAGSSPAMPIDDWSHRLRELWFKEPRETPTKVLTCRDCGVEFYVSAINKRELKRKFCGDDCAKKFRARNKPTVKKLKSLMMKHNWSALGRLYGVSDNAVRKWAKGYGLL